MQFWEILGGKKFLSEAYCLYLSLRRRDDPIERNQDVSSL